MCYPRIPLAEGAGETHSLLRPLLSRPMPSGPVFSTLILCCSSELNLGIQASGFTVVKSCRPIEELKNFLTVIFSRGCYIIIIAVP